MFRDFLKNHLFIGALVFFVFCVGGSLLYMWYVDRQGKKEVAETQKRVKEWNKRQNPQPPATIVVVEDPPRGGHVHADSTFHAEPHDVPMEVVPLSAEDVQTIETMDWENLTPNEIMYLLNKQRWPHLTQAQREIVHREFYAQSVGAEPPPEGYYYRVYPDGRPVLDDNGKPRLYKVGEPIIAIKKGIGFAPTREQYQRYKQLTKSYHRAYNAGKYAEADRIQVEIEQLEAASQGEIPIATSSIMSRVGRDAADRAAAKSKVDAAIDEAYREMGLGYMVDED